MRRDTKTLMVARNVWASVALAGPDGPARGDFTASPGATAKQVSATTAAFFVPAPI
jgi:hypothetical protein